ncbi:MAG TPA: beta-ketoacyl synthase N-terminal-like domain-containing protein [Thermoanaerobaculia bacterium]|jgi:3-oxoacyl-[acyl-carrier-protein] synthase II|nr:beta-ketoacyl synthase N-terminal-like domain-containing protein [Thermoanaerobaculia bacterium]
MRRSVVVTGAGVLSPLADSPAGLHAALCAGRSGLKEIELFPLDGLSINGSGPRQAGEIRPFEPRDYLGERNLRPIDRTSRLLLAAAQRALDESGWTPELRAEREVGLMLGTVFCSVKTIAEFDRRGLQLGPSHVSPMDFANSVINAAAGQAAIWHGLRGVNSTISAGEASGLLAIASGASQIRGGHADALLAGGAEELCFESFLGHLRAGRLCGPGDPLPFDARRCGFALAEGAALLMLEEAVGAAARGAGVLAEVLGHGSAFDPSETADGAAEAMKRAVWIALEDAEVVPGDLDAVSVSASGSVAVDRAEAAGLAAALGTFGAGLPLTAIKSMLGEALGASGGFQAVAALGVFGDGALPGILGFERGEDGFPLTGAVARTRRVDGVRHVLLTALSADGHACAVVLGAPDSRA